MLVQVDGIITILFFHALNVFTTACNINIHEMRDSPDFQGNLQIFLGLTPDFFLSLLGSSDMAEVSLCVTAILTFWTICTI